MVEFFFLLINFLFYFFDKIIFVYNFEYWLCNSYVEIMDPMGAVITSPYKSEDILSQLNFLR